MKMRMKLYYNHIPITPAHTHMMPSAVHQEGKDLATTTSYTNGCAYEVSNAALRAP